VWNGWKGQLLRTLYYETEPVLTGGHSQVSRDLRVAAAQEELAAALADWPKKERDAYLKRHYPAYWLRVDLPRKIAHAAFIREVDREKRPLATAIFARDFEAVTEITVFAPDHPRLLSIIAAACTIAGANIVDAQVYTTTDGQALDSISISREFADNADEERRGRKVGDLIEQALAGTIRLPEQIAQRTRKKPRLKAFQLETEIGVDNELSNQFTVIETSGLDRPGLLYDLTRTISDLNLNIASAHVSTFGERAIDVFYVTDLLGHKVVNGAREAAIRRRLAAAFDGQAQAETRPARRKEPA
jgi:[protein-PII] uridylyltransferase